ncbi:TPA: hypothetical protein ACU21B_000244 [Mannheimia haemolytica]
MYGLNTLKQNSVSAYNRAFISYTQSEVAALIAGYVEVADNRAYNGRCFIKNGKKWIHNLNALRAKLNNEYGRYIDDEELSASYPEGFAYDVENYYSRHQNNTLLGSTQFKNVVKKVILH